MMTTDAIPPADFQIEAADDALGLYQFGLKSAKHYFCRNCGIYTFHVTARQPDHYRANLGCIEDIDPFSLDTEIFDGKNLL